ncbi:MAG: right-handed parallel beta-helix repeat-containing protein, partial [Bryobacteraceae bacterium]
MNTDLTVYLEGGTYRLTRSLLLDSRDSGTNVHNIIYTSAPGQKAVISGAVRVTGWKLVDAKKNLW